MRNTRFYFFLFILFSFISCSEEVENNLFKQETSFLDNPIALFIKEKEETKVNGYNFLIEKRNNKKDIQKSINSDLKTLTDEYGEILYENLKVIDSINTNTLFPLVDSNGKLKTWMLGYYNNNGEIEVRVKKIESNLVTKNSNDISILTEKKVLAPKNNFNTTKSVQNISKSNGSVCGDEYIWVCAWTIGNEDEKECGWNFNGYKCYDLNAPELVIDGGGSSPSDGWIDPFGEDDSGAPVGGGSDSGDNEGEDNSQTPPNCKIFNYIKTGSNWQECNIEGIYFHVWITRTVPPYAEYKYTVHIDEPVNFGAPLFDRFGNDLDSGKLASASANALHEAMRATVHEFDAAAINNPSDIDAFFKQKIRDDFPLHIIGGRATPNTTSNLPASQYESTPDPNFGGCDKS